MSLKLLLVLVILLLQLIITILLDLVIIIITQLDQIKSASGSIKKLKVYSQTPNIPYLFLHTHIPIAILDQLHIIMAFSLYFMMEILIQTIGLLTATPTIATGVMPKNQLDFIFRNSRCIGSLTPLQLMPA